MMYYNNFIAVIKHKGKIMRDTNGFVRLPFGSEYSVLLKNKDSRTAVVRIEIDGEDVMGGHRYIIPGNSTRELEGFLKGLRASHKFRFIEKTKEISRFRGDRIDDGIVRVEFWYEQRAQVTPWVTYNMFHTHDNTSDIRYTANFAGDYTQCSTHYLNTSPSVKCKRSAPKTDEGITVKGTKANQQFNYGNVGALEFQSSVIVIRLKGVVRKRGKVKKIKKPITVKTRIQCPTCGRRWRSYLKFCGNCSTALD